MTTPIVITPWSYVLPGRFGSPDVRIEAENIAGGIKFSVKVDTSSGRIGDFRGLFFNVAGNPASSLKAIGTDVTKTKVGNVLYLSYGADMFGYSQQGFDVGVEIGKEGIGPGKGDIQSTTFTVAGITLNDIIGQSFGASLTSVGKIGECRTDSSRLTGNSPLTGITASLQDGLLLKNFTDTDANPGQTVSISEGANSSVTFTVSVVIPDLPPVADIILVQDLTGSFIEDLPNVRTAFGSLYDSLNTDGDFQFGVASFRDKPILPFGEEGDFEYITNQAVTDSKATVQTQLDGLSAGGGADTPEAQLEALLKIANRSSEIGWRSESKRIVVINTDAEPHVAGDWPGVPANNGDGIVETIPPGEDYPSIAQVKAALDSAGIIPIFAVTADVLGYYQNLNNELGGTGAVVQLDSNSSNLEQAIKDALGELTVDVIPTVVADDYNLVSSFTPASHLAVDGPATVTFDVTLAPSTSYGSDNITFDLGDYGQVNIDVQIAPSTLTGTIGNDTLTGNNAGNTIVGLAGADIINGNGGSDILNGGKGNDLFSGGLGSDKYVIVAGDGSDTISDFLVGAVPQRDIIEFAASTGLLNFAGVAAASTQSGLDTLITYAGGIIKLENNLATNLVSSNFTFV